MSDASSSTPAAQAATTQPAATEAAASTATEAEEKAPDPSAELEAHVQHALKQGKKKEAAAKAKETKAAKGTVRKAEPAPAKEPVASADAEPTEPVRDEPPPAFGFSKVRKLAEEGKLDEAFELAFGKKPQDFNINSAKWAEYRKVHQRDKQKLAETRAAYERDYAQLRADAREIAGQFEPLLKARKSWEAGNLEEAIKLAFGSDVTDFNKRLIKAAHGKNPEVEELRRELRERDERDRREREEREQRTQAEQAERTRQEAIGEMTSMLQKGEDEQIAFLAKKRSYINRVIEILQEHYDERSRTTLPIPEAADMARNEDEFIDIVPPRHAGVTAATVQGGSNPARPERSSTTLSQQGATEPTAPPRGWHGLSLDDQVRQFVAPKPNGARA